jgi:aminobenzoyl-glutamate utilization protein A
MHPELGWTEFRTASLIARQLSALGFELQLGREALASDARVGVPPAMELERAYALALRQGAAAEYLDAFEGGHTAVIGTVRGSAPGPTTAIRVDIDALPIQEDGTLLHNPTREGFASIRAGCMHACGHDAHAAIGVGLARVLTEIREDLAGTVKVLFQPAEEGGRGALPMVEAGAVDDVDDFIAIHIGMGAPSGKLMTRVDGHLASAKFDVRFDGASAHAGARPDEGKNALLAAAQAAMGLHAIPRHHVGRSRVNVGALRAGSGRNTIADQATMLAEVRGDTDGIVDYLLARSRAVVEGAALAHEVTVAFELAGRTTVADSDPELSLVVHEAAAGTRSLVVDPAPFPAYGSEDATYLMRRVQEHGGRAIYAVIGSDLASGHHTPRFDVDEATFGPAIEALARTVLALGRKGRSTGSWR